MKHQLILQVESLYSLKGGLLHIVLTQPDGGALPLMHPGQFVELAVDRANVLLNRPFSIFNYTADCLELLIKPLGRASAALASYSRGDMLRVIAPLGRGFTMPTQGRVALIGGGVGVAPLYYQAKTLKNAGLDVTIVYGERTAPDETLCNKLADFAELQVCTDDGSAGFHGFAIDHPVVRQCDYDLLQVCGPMPMMRALHRFACEAGIDAEFSLENKMACGLGACLCCVEETTTGNRCVCTDGPVFKKEELPW